MFQFQSGTIKASRRRSRSRSRKRFQFQSGTIKAFLLRLCQRCPFGFNSNLVRLRRFTKTYPDDNTTMFQFQSGTIKAFTNEQGPPRQRGFQFQSGTIKAFTSLKHSKNKPCCFNSNLVRLRLANNTQQSNIIPRFNSNLVRLRHPNGRFAQESEGCFNSNLVRLRRLTQKPLLSAIPSFNSNLVRLRPPRHPNTNIPDYEPIVKEHLPQNGGGKASAGSKRIIPVYRRPAYRFVYERFR